MAFAGRHERGALREGTLTSACGARWPVSDGWARLYRAEEVRGTDRWMNLIYDRLAPLHDPMVRVALPLCGTGTEVELRTAYLRRLRLDTLPPGPLRVLEVGIGTGANVPLVGRALGPGRPVEWWGVDLALGMARICRRRFPLPAGPRIVLADAHALPFAADAFDVVFHVGATNNYRDPRLALAEMARVARPGAPIVVVDERLDPRGAHSLWHRLAFYAVCFYNPFPEEPTAALPPDARDVLDEQVARFFYCLSFRKAAT